ncbi:MAG TPA: S8 family serine peptidase [Allosphingosinicella sp.]|jgi:subtilisin family serine protease
MARSSSKGGKGGQRGTSGSGDGGSFSNPFPSGGGVAATPPEPRDGSGRLSVLVEMRSPAGGSPASAMASMESMSLPGVTIDNEFMPVPMGQSQAPGHAFSAEASSAEETVVVRAIVDDESQIEALRQQPGVLNVYKDTPIAPFASRTRKRSQGAASDEMPSMAPCPIGTCDCAPTVPKGTIADVATYLGCNQIWAAGFRGAGIVVGVVDSGITASGRPVKAGQTARRIPRVIGGWPTSDWGTESGQWADHGNMCATDVLGMAPDARLYDLRVAGAGGSPGTISRALQAFQWAIDRYMVDGTPQVLTNSWGIFQENWDATYARNPNHPFTRKVVEAINLGILVLFAAGNCGDTCPDGRCGQDTGPGRSIWGANGHPRVITVGAVNRLEQFIGYSSRGPAALDPNKPDFCSVSHFTGYFNSDSGTSAATPITAGVVALLKQAKPSLTQDQVKAALKSTAKDIGPAGFDQHSGAGIINAKRAYDRVRQPPTNPVLDAVTTHSALDQISTNFGGDTNPVRDVLKHPISDPVTNPRIDLLKVPARDIFPERRLPPGFPPSLARRGYGRRQAPFALAMPHQVDWQGESGEAELEDLEAQIEALAGAIAAQQDQLQQLINLHQQMAGWE